MESIKNVKLGLDPKKMEVVVSADITMKDETDKDDLYLIMFNIMDNPLRLSLFTIGDLFGLGEKEYWDGRVSNNQDGRKSSG